MKYLRKTLSAILAAALLAPALTLPVFAAGTVNSPGSILAGMSVEEKISQMLMPELRYYTDGNGEKKGMAQLTPDAAALLEKYGFAGIVQFAQNLGDTAASARLIDDIQKANASAPGRTQLLIASDQEGGKVTRLGFGTQMPGNMALGAAGDAGLTSKAAEIIGGELMSLGINFNFAPVLDVNSNPANPVIGTRSFSDDPAIAAEHGVSYMKALMGTGAISTLKHFPGHGDTATDSHTGLPLVDRSYEELKSRELIPFKAAIDAGAEAVMTAHIQYPQIEKSEYTSKLTGEKIKLPATLSKTVLTDILRGDMGFDGVIITDAMNMDAIAKHFDRYDAAKLAIDAGVDILLMPVDTSSPEGLADLGEYIETLACCVRGGEISEAKVDAAVLRILKLKEAHGLTGPYAGSGSSALQTVGSRAHHDAEWKIAKKSITLVKNDNNTLPIAGKGGKTVVLTAYNNEVLSMEHAVGRLRDEGKLADGSEVTVYSIYKKTSEEAIALASGADHVVIVTELDSRAGLTNAASGTVDALIENAHKEGADAVIMSCSLPYDAARYQAADAVVIVWSSRGMSEDPRVKDGAVAQYGPSMPAALYLIFSPDETPEGTLPVNIPKLDPQMGYSGEILYERGFGLRYASAAPFTDVNGGAWFAEGVRFCVENGLMGGVSKTGFAPFSYVDRAMIATVLWRLAGKPAASGPDAFSDTERGRWYSEAVSWAAGCGVVNGSGGRFSPYSDITREQFAAILYRYAKLDGRDVSAGEDADSLSYDDAAYVSGWAVQAMRWAVGTDVIGPAGGRLDPKGHVTRAEAAQIFMNFGTIIR